MAGRNELAILARQDAGAMQRLKQQYQPLIAARIVLHMGFYRPEYMEAGMEAVEEAVMSYSPDKGSFITHLRSVLRFRLIDLRRREKVDKVVPVSSLSEEHHTHAVNRASVSRYQEEYENALRREEIGRYCEELSRLNLTLQEVADSSPRHASTREACRRACRYMLERPALLEKVLSGRVPGKELSEALNVSAKTWERHRKYLIACAVAVSGDYHCISGYILSREGEA